MSFLRWLKGFFIPGDPRALLAQIEELLVAEIPPVVKAAGIDESVYCLRIWYNGTDSPEDAVPWLMLVKESTRQQFLAAHAGNAPHYLWCADEATYPGQAYNVMLEGKRLERLYRKWYRHLSALEEDEELQPFREMVQRVARRLNELPWGDLAPVTDDFVVCPADLSQTFCDDRGDLVASISADQMARLQERSLLPPESEED
jgi:hypothetical protein